MGGNPTTATDPSGHERVYGDKFIVGGGGGGGGWAGYSLVGAAVAAGIYSALTAPTLADGTLREPDEMDRADARMVDVGFENWNQVSANRYKAAHPTKTTTTTTTPTDTPTPPTQPGNDGAPPKGPRSPVASPAHPDDNGCGCGDDPTIYLHHGTSLENAESIMQNGIDVSQLSNGAFYATRDVLAAQGFAARAVDIGNAQAILVYGIAQSVLTSLLSGGLAREQLMNFPYADQTEFVFQEGAFDTLNASVFGIYEPVDGKLRFRPC